MSDNHDTNGVHDVVIEDGKLQPMPPREVRAAILKMLDEGEVLAVILSHHGQFAVQVFGPPSMEMVEALEEVVRDFRTAVQNAS